MSYKVYRDNLGNLVGFGPNNEHYDQSNENYVLTIEDIMPSFPISVPKVVTMKQARLALLQAGLLDQVNTALAAMTGIEGQAAQINWEFSETVNRTEPLVQSLTLVLELTELQLDDLFTLAATL